jgi:hypothetical protein
MATTGTVQVPSSKSVSPRRTTAVTMNALSVINEDWSAQTVMATCPQTVGGAADRRPSIAVQLPRGGHIGSDHVGRPPAATSSCSVDAL